MDRQELDIKHSKFVESEPLLLPLSTPILHKQTKKPQFFFFRVLFVFVLCLLLSRTIINLSGVVVTGFLSSIHTSMMADEYPIPSDITIENCAQWASTRVAPYSSLAEFQLSVDLDSIFFISRGSMSHGEIIIVQSDLSADSNKAEIEVEVDYDDSSFLDHVKVCEISRGAKERGIGIFTPNWRGPRPPTYRPYFKIRVDLPRSAGTSPLALNSLETDLPMFRHEIGDLSGINFKNLSFRTVNVPVTVESANGENIAILNANAPIQGSFNTSSFISLRTANAHINVHLGLLNTDEAKATRAELKTANSYIGAYVKLTTPSSSAGTGGNFSLDAKTAGGKVTVDFLDSPIDSILKLEAATSLAPVDVHLHPTYQGSFSLQTSIAAAQLNVNEEVEDPSGNNKKRNVDVFKAGYGNVEGLVWWSEEKKLAGSATLMSSIAPVLLSF